MVAGFTRLKLRFVNIGSCQITHLNRSLNLAKKRVFSPLLERSRKCFFMSSKTQFLRYFFVYQEKQWFQKTDKFFDQFQKMSQFLKPNHEKMSQFLKPNHEIGFKEIRTLDSFIYIGFQVMQVESCHVRLRIKLQKKNALFGKKQVKE